MPANSICFRDAASPTFGNEAVRPSRRATPPDTPPVVRLTFSLSEPQLGPITYRQRNCTLRAIEQSITTAHAERASVEVVFEDAGAVDPIFLRQCIHAAHAAASTVRVTLGGEGDDVSAEHVARMTRDVGVFLDPGAFVIGAVQA